MSDDYRDERIIILNDVDEESSSSSIKDLFSFAQKDKKKPIYVIVNSYGGSVYEMFAIYDAIQYVKSMGITVYTMGIGKVMSSGLVILVGGSVRDLVLNRDLKDLDIEVHNVTLAALETILKKFGKVKFIGKKFGVLRIMSSAVDKVNEFSLTQKKHFNNIIEAVHVCCMNKVLFKFFSN